MLLPCPNSQVLSALSAASSAPEVFPASAQYAERKKNQKKAKASNNKKPPKDEEIEDYDEEDVVEEAEDEEMPELAISAEPVKSQAALVVGVPATKPPKSPEVTAGATGDQAKKKPTTFGA